MVINTCVKCMFTQVTVRRTWHLELALQVQAEYSLVGTYQRDQSLTEGSKDTGSKSEYSGILISTDSVLIAMLHRATCGQPKDRKSTRLNSSHSGESRMPSSA